jgi:hypothetical protein
MAQKTRKVSSDTYLYELRRRLLLRELLREGWVVVPGRAGWWLVLLLRLGRGGGRGRGGGQAGAPSKAAARRRWCVESLVPLRCPLEVA